MAGEVQNITDEQKTLYPSKAVKTMLNEQLVFRPKLKTSLPPGAKVTTGFTINFGARLYPGQNGGQAQDGGNLPTPKRGSYRTFVFNPTLFCFGYQIGYVAAKVLTSSQSTFTAGGDEDQQMQETMSNMGKFIEQTYVGTAGDGIRGYVEADGSNTVTLRNPEAGANLLREGMVISVRIAAGSTVRDSLDNRTITAYNPDTRVLTYSGADQTAVANDPIYVVVEATQTLTSTFANGIRGQIDDGTNSQFIHTLDRTTALNVKLKSVVDDNGGTPRNLSEQIVMRTCMKVVRRSGMMPDTILWGPGQTLKYAEMIQPQRFYPTTGKNRQGSAVGIQNEDVVFFGPGVKLTVLTNSEGQVSFDVIPREAYLITWSTMFMYSAVDAEWMDEQSVRHLAPNTSSGFKASYLSYLASVENFGTDYPLANAVIRDLKDNEVLSDG